MDSSTNTPQEENQTFSVISDEPLQTPTETPNTSANPLNTGNGTPAETPVSVVSVVSKEETPHEIKLDSASQDQSKTEETFSMGAQTSTEPAKKSSLFKSYGIPVIVVVGLTILGLAGYYVYTIYSEPEIVKSPEKPAVTATEKKEETPPAAETPAKTETPVMETPSATETPAVKPPTAPPDIAPPPSFGSNNGGTTPETPVTDVPTTSTKIPRR